MIDFSNITSDIKNKKLRLAQALQQQGKYHEAIDRYHTILADYPDDPDTLVFLGFAKSQQGAHQEAVRFITRAIQINPKVPFYHCNLAVVLNLLGNKEAAIESYQSAIRLDPNLAEAYYNLGILYREQDDLKAAERAYLETLRIKPDFSYAHNSLANILQSQDRLDEAIKSYRNAIQLKPDLAIAYSNLAAVYNLTGNYTLAIDTCQKTLQLHANSAESYFSIGYAYLELNQSKSARKCFLRAIKMKPDMDKAYFYLGNTEQKYGDNISALDYYRQALALNPDSIDYIAKLANLLERTNNANEAMNLVTMGLKRKPGNPSLCVTKANLLRRQGKFQSAIDILLGALEKQPNESIISDIHQRLGQCYDRMNMPTKAFTHFTAGKKLTADIIRRKGINKDIYLDTIDEARKMCTNELANCSAPPVHLPNNLELAFLVGFPRSGTTLLEQMLDSHPQINTLEEKPATLSMFRQLNRKSITTAENLMQLSDHEITDLRNVYFKSIRQYSDLSECSLFVDKLPLNLDRAHVIWRLFPEARFILAIRHPCDACLSCFMQGFDLNKAMANFCTLEDTVNLYVKLMSNWRKYVETLPIKYYRIRYEDVVSDFEHEIRPLLDFLGVGWHEQVTNHTQHAQSRKTINTPSYHQVSQPIYQHAKYRWEKYRIFLEPYLDKLTPFIEYFGYNKP